MKKVILSLIFVLVSFSVFSDKEQLLNHDTPKFPKGEGAILLDDLKEGKVYGSLEKIIGKKKAKEMRLIGHSSFDAPKDKMLVGNKFVLIGWLGVQKIKDVSKVVLFKEPIVSSFIVRNDVDASGVALPTFGQREYLEEAIKDLEAGKIDPEDCKKRRIIKTPTGQGSETVLPAKSGHNKNKHPVNHVPPLDGEKSLDSAPKSDVSEGATLLSSGDLQSKQRSSDTQSMSKSPFNPNFGATGSQYGGLGFENLNGRDLAANRTNAASPDQLINRNNTVNIPGQPLNNVSRPTFARNQDFELHILPALDEDHLPEIRGEAVVLVREADNHQEAYFVRNGAFARDRQGNLIHRAVEVNLEGLPDGRVERNAENRDRVNQIIDDVMFNYRDSEQGQRDPIDFGPEVTVEITEEGCLPEHDELQERVTILSRARSYENGHLVDEGNCEKTLETYEVKRDYLCENCQDEVDRETRKAYARYMEYWIDKEGQRHNLGIKLDRGVPFEFFEDTQACGFNTEAEEEFAIRMSRLGYLNKFRAFKVVENCRVIEGAERFPVHETVRGCEPIHNFVDRVSFEQKRSFFTVDRVEHEVLPCHPIEPALPHQFSMIGCYPIVDLTNHTVTDTARRRIMTSTGLKVISEDCEPTDNHVLDVTRDGCEGEYTHGLVAMRSYLKKRYYFPRGHNHREYVTGCVRTDDFIEQQTESNGIYEHDNVAKVSKPQLSLYIEGDRGRINIEPARVRGELGQVAYTLVRNEHRPTASIYYEGCFRRTRTQSVNVYTRGDGSPYEQIMGPGNIIASTRDECTGHRVEKTLAGPRGGYDYTTYAWSERTVCVNPHGAVHRSAWVEKSRTIQPSPDRQDSRTDYH